MTHTIATFSCSMRKVLFALKIVRQQQQKKLFSTNGLSNSSILSFFGVKPSVTSNFCGRRVFSTDNKMNKPKVYVTRLINEEALDVLQQQCEVTLWKEEGPVPRDELLQNIKGKDALLCMLSDVIDEQVLNECPSLKVIATMSVGYDHLKLDAIKKQKIRVGYTPNILTDATAELTIALLLSTSRRLIEASHEAKSGGWKAWAPFWMCGPGLSGSTVGIVGFGRIGQAVARCVKGFNVKNILFQNRSDKSKEAKELGATQVSFDDLIARSDFVIATCSLTPETKEMFNMEIFKKMKSTAIFINTSRGGVVNQEDLISALKNNVIWGAGLDVTTPEPLPLDSPLFKLKNCVVLPHIGSAAISTRKKMAMLSVRNVISGLKNEEMPAELQL